MTFVQQIIEQFVLTALWPLAAAIAATMIYICLVPIWRRVEAYRLVAEARKAVDRTVSNGRSTEGPGFWLKPPVRRLPQYSTALLSSIPILMIGTLKGGVGKTTLSANLAAHYALCWLNRNGHSLRVLLIDLDFQGSLSTMTLRPQDNPNLICKANKLVSGELSFGRLVGEAQRVDASGMIAGLSISTIRASYDLAQAENRSMIEWLLPRTEFKLLERLLRLFRIKDGQETKSKVDLRYRLAQALLDSSVQDEFDLVIIDAPPRLTTSHVQAMCASKYVLIPTIADRLSGDALARYLDQIAILKQGPTGASESAICPHIEPIGVVCTMIPATRGDLTGVINELDAKLKAAPLRPQLLRDPIWIKQRSPYCDCAGERIAYAEDSRDQSHRDLRDEMDGLGMALAPKLGSETWGWTLKQGRFDR